MVSAGLPGHWPSLGLDFGIPFWTLLPAFLFLSVIISIQANGESIAQQRAARRDDRAVDFRKVQGALAGTGAANLMAGVAGAQRVYRQVRRPPGLGRRDEGTAERRLGGDSPDPGPLDLEGLVLDEEETEDAKSDRQLVVVASSDGPVADLEFIGSGDEENMEDRLRQLQQYDSETPVEQELSLRLLRAYASSVQHQQFHDIDIITVRVRPPGT